MHIRKSTLSDSQLIKQLHLEAFDSNEREDVSRLALELISESESVQSLVAIEGDEIIGHVVFSPMRITPSNDVLAYILAPLAVAPAKQKQGVGSKLIQSGLDTLTAIGIDAVFVLGDPNYYSRSGFNIRHSVKTPYQLAYPEAWLALELKAGSLQGVSGTADCLSALMFPKLW